MDEDASKVVRILLDAVIEGLDLLLIEKSQYSLPQLAAAFARDDFHEADPLVERFVNDVS